MIEYTKGDILKSDAEAIVNTVNCVGVMGRGIALQFKNAFPANYLQYKHACDNGEVKPGEMLIHPTGTLTNPRYIINFPTKRHWKGKSKIEDIDSGLNSLVVDIKKLDIKSIAIPPLGSGLGGLHWGTVRQLIKEKFANIDDVKVIVYEPIDMTANTKSQKVPNMTASRAVIIKLTDRYLQSLLDPFVSLLEVQKLMYFMQVVGEPLKLDYHKDTYGPYAPNLRHVLNTIEGHYLVGYGDGGDNPSKPLQVVDGAVSAADEYLNSKQTTIGHLNKVSQVVSGFETAFGLELLATVHWVITNEGTKDDDDLVNKVHSWNERKRKFTTFHINQAKDQLLDSGII